MTEKILQHRHCAKCGKAHLGEDRFCSPECETISKETMKKKKTQLTILYVGAVGVLLLALFLIK